MVIALRGNSQMLQQKSGNKSAEEQAEKDIEKQLEDIKKLEKDGGPKVVEDLIKAVLTVDPKVPDRTEQPTVQKYARIQLIQQGDIMAQQIITLHGWGISMYP